MLSKPVISHPHAEKQVSLNQQREGFPATERERETARERERERDRERQRGRERERRRGRERERETERERERNSRGFCRAVYIGQNPLTIGSYTRVRVLPLPCVGSCVFEVNLHAGFFGLGLRILSLADSESSCEILMVTT